VVIIELRVEIEETLVAGLAHGPIDQMGTGIAVDGGDLPIPGEPEGDDLGAALQDC
jgi:hypothetical protein